MTTHLYTGTVTSFSENPIPNATPRMWVQPKFSAIGPNGPLLTRPVPVTIAEDGAFAVSLVASVDTVPPAEYVLHVDWLDASGFAAGWSEWEFRAQAGGGPIDPGGPPLSVWFVGPPWPPGLPPGFYFDKITNDVGRKE